MTELFVVDALVEFVRASAALAFGRRRLPVLWLAVRSWRGQRGWIFLI
jgi:hypothetical protein